MKHKLFITVIYFTTITSYAQFLGGNNDGYSSGIITTTMQNGAFVLLDNVYKSGNGDGFSKHIITALLTGEDTSVLFFGSDGDGFSSNLITGILSLGFKPNLYLGGNGDGFASKLVRTEFTLDVIEELIKFDIILYPNPTNHIVNIKPSKGVTITSIKLYDVSGKKFLIELSKENTINVSNLSNGIYLLNIFSENRGISKKLIIKK